jgi:hypothetical protein
MRFQKVKKQTTTLKPILPLIPEVLASQEDDKSQFVTFEVKTKAGGNNRNTSTHKRSLRLFEDGSPQQWLELVEEVRRIWTQNSTSEGLDRAATLRAVLKGEALIAFEAAIDDSRDEAEEEDPQAITAENVDQAIVQVTKTIFLHCALELQQLWMKRYMRKPEELTTRKMAGAITRINNYLPMFPDATAASKFSESDLIGLLEWSLPEDWRSKFDLDGYIPTMHTKARLIEECEAIERNIVSYNNNDDDNNSRNNKKQKSGNPRAKDKNVGGGEEDRSNRYFCSECGHNPTHNTKRCRKIRWKRQQAQQHASPARKHDGAHKQKEKPFSKRTFRKELNALTRKAARKNCLNLVVKMVERVQAKEAKCAGQTKKSKKDDSSDSGSESDESIQVIENVTKKPKAQKTNVRAVVTGPAKPSEDKAKLAYKLRLANLKKRFDETKATRKLCDTTALEEANFLKKVIQMEEKQCEEESVTSNDSLIPEQMDSE